MQFYLQSVANSQSVYLDQCLHVVHLDQCLRVEGAIIISNRKRHPDVRVIIISLSKDRGHKGLEEPIGVHPRQEPNRFTCSLGVCLRNGVCPHKNVTAC